MSYRNKILIQNLVESRKEESIRIHNQFVNAMEMRSKDEEKDKRLIKTILADFPEEEKNLPHNFD